MVTSEPPGVQAALARESARRKERNFILVLRWFESLDPAETGRRKVCMTTAAETSTRFVSAASLGAPGPVDPARCSVAAIDALSGAAGEGFGMTSLALDVTSTRLGSDEIEVRVQTDKRSRSIVFASAEAWQRGQLVFSAQGLFSRRNAK